MARCASPTPSRPASGGCLSPNGRGDAACASEIDSVSEVPRPERSGSGSANLRVPVVHAVTDDGILTRASFPERALAVMQVLGPRGAVHLRARILPARRLLALAEALRLAEQETGCWLVVNDRLDVALGTGARAVQLTSRSMRIADARH